MTGATTLFAKADFADKRANAPGRNQIIALHCNGIVPKPIKNARMMESGARKPAPRVGCRQFSF